MSPRCHQRRTRSIHALKPSLAPLAHSCSAPTCGLSDSSVMCHLPRRPPLQSFVSRGSMRDHFRLAATTWTSRAPMQPTVPIPNLLHLCAALATQVQRVHDQCSQLGEVSHRAEALPFPFLTVLHSRAALAIRYRCDNNRHGPTYNTSHPTEACALTCAASHSLHILNIFRNHLGYIGCKFGVTSGHVIEASPAQDLKYTRPQALLSIPSTPSATTRTSRAPMQPTVPIPDLAAPARGLATQVQRV
ncbi:hypothetical protein H4582DRAFT_2057880 [Lactarius indigo]|nr:hypothetical protein H4582DRAFT_2057880 [Lactarius indigo]